MEKQKKLMEKMQENISLVQRVKNDDEMRCKKQAEEADRSAYEAEVNKQARLKQMRQETQAFLFKQMAEKDDRKKQALELKSLQAQILDADSQEYGSIEAQKKIEKLQKYHAFRGELENQMASNQLRKNPAMSENEMKMNRRLLDLVDRTFEHRDQEMAMDVIDDIGPEDAAVQ